MACVATYFNGLPCKNKSKKYGVCSLHSKKAKWITEEDSEAEKVVFNEFVNKYQELMRQMKLSADSIESRGLNLLQVQRAYNGNLTSQPNYALLNDHDEISFVTKLDESLNLIRAYQQLIDPYLIYNAAVEIRNQLLT